MLTIVMLFVLVAAYMLMFGTVRFAENLITKRQLEIPKAARGNDGRATELRITSALRSELPMNVAIYFLCIMVLLLVGICSTPSSIRSDFDLGGGLRLRIEDGVK